MKRTIYFMKEWQGVGKFICLSFGIALFGMSDYCSAAMRGTNSPGIDANDAELQEVLRLSRLEWEQNDPAIQAAIRDSLEQRQNQTNPYGGMQPRPVSPIPEMNDANDADLQDVLRLSRQEWEENDPAIQAAIRDSLEQRQNQTNPYGGMQPGPISPTNPQGVTQPRPASPNQDGHEEDPELQEALRLSMMWGAGGENGPLPASGPQQGLPNEQQSAAQIRAEQDRDFADALARQQAAERLEHETNAPIVNPDESVNLQTPEEMLSGLTKEELRAIGCPETRKKDFANRMFSGFDAAGSLEDRFYAILEGLAQIHQVNRTYQSPGYHEVMKKLIRAWGEAFKNWNGHNQMLDSLKPIAKNLPEDIISSDTLMLLP